MECTDLIRSRHSVRRYTLDKIPDDVVTDILDCGRLAPTARNIQPWKIGAVKDRDLLLRIGDTCETGPFIKDCSVCFAVFCLKDEKYYLEDGCAAIMNIITACQAHGIGSCWIAGDKKGYAQEIRKILGLPDDYALVGLVSCGYARDAPTVKLKRSLEESSFLNQY
ncbi:nitroreductase family protein [Candidatus Altiarchaeota archaeon]